MNVEIFSLVSLGYDARRGMKLPMVLQSVWAMTLELFCTLVGSGPNRHVACRTDRTLQRRVRLERSITQCDVEGQEA